MEVIPVNKIHRPFVDLMFGLCRHCAEMRPMKGYRPVLQTRYLTSTAQRSTLDVRI